MKPINYDNLPAVGTLLDALAERLYMHLEPENALLVGIHTGGVWVAEALGRRLPIRVPQGTLDISFYRDDLDRGGLRPHLRSSRLPINVDGKHVWLVDDILHTGRTVRAAINEIFDFGRPASIRLLVLIDRGGRELPIYADLVGLKQEFPASIRLRLQGPDALKLILEPGKPSV